MSRLKMEQACRFPPVGNGWKFEKLDSWGEFDRNIGVFHNPSYSMRLFYADGVITMHNKNGDPIGQWHGHLPEMSSSLMPVVRDVRIEPRIPSEEEDQGEDIPWAG